MTSKEFAKFLARDLHCLHCGRSGDDLVPQHRIGRGQGGKNSKAARPSNIIVLCSLANGLLESDARFAREGRQMGWKLLTWQEPEAEAVFNAWTGQWWLLDDGYGRSPA